MTHLFKLVLLRTGLLLGLMLSALPSEAQRTRELVILHTNDTHSRIEPLPANFKPADRADKAGFVRRATLVREMRREHPDLLLFDCGDFSQGTPYYNMFQGEVEVRLMNAAGYDAGTIGNHEFDFGLDNMCRIFRMARYPIVCANYDFTGTVLEKVVKPYTIIRRHGLKIGVFGLSPRMEGLVQECNYEGVTYKDPVEAANEVAALLKEKEHCDLVVCLSHLGWKSGLNNPESDEYLIPRTRHIDIVLGGHSHSLFSDVVWYRNLDGEQVALQQMGKNGEFVGKMTVKLSRP